MPRIVKLALHDIAHPEVFARHMQHAAAELASEFPALLGFRLGAERLTGADGKGRGVEIHVELLLPQHQIVLNRAATTPKAALDAALAAARSEIERVFSRDPALAPVRVVEPKPASLAVPA